MLGGKPGGVAWVKIRSTCAQRAIGEGAEDGG